ncbi:MAG: hypothetical protein NTZ27_03650 [Ignavibacteriales bacterium]|nr:hypothetical protein [Ignavibacteriales bacterium]
MKKDLLVKYLTCFLLSLSFFKIINGQTIDQKYFNGLQWRMIGPHRGGRTVGAVGVREQPNVFYIGVNNGGVWKTNDFGRTWIPIFDQQPTGSIGDIVVAPSNPNVIYVGSGEGVQRPDLSIGDGIYKSTDAGKTWINTGLKDAQQIGGLAIDPKNENRVFVAALGHPYGPNTERGVYRTLDGGKTWERVLYKDENTGAIQVSIDPNNSNIIYADLWAGRQGPWENGEWNGQESGLFKSTDGGSTWKKLTKGLPTTEQGLGRIGFCIAPSNSNRMYATVDSRKYGGIYRSDDAGESWTMINSDGRLWGRGDDFAEIKVDPFNSDIVYSANVVVWKSVDGGKTWSGFRGAPGGDDYHRIWINPDNSNIMLIASDQGAIVTVNGGESFSSWYNQPTAQFFHVSADNAFPYNVYSGQQESGSIGIASRGNDGQITFREWHPVGAEEYGYVIADPKDSNIIYGGKISKYDKRTGQTQNISPEAVRSGKSRFIRTAPILFNPIDNKTLYYAGNVLFKTLDGGNSWEIISPDLSRESWDIPASVGIYTKDEMKKMPRRGVIYTVAPSYVDINTIWCGTDDGLIHVTRDGGKTWKNVTPPEITSWSKVSLMDASHTDINTSYAAVNRIRLDDMRPYIYRTNDGGKTWKEIVNGLPNDPINVVKEDPYRKGLLFAGSETAVYVSFDDGENWQSLRLNMPATSIRDLIIKDDDLVIATHGRSFWILDDITPLRQLSVESKKMNTILFKPQNAYRVRWNMNTDTPLPQEEPAGQNPPEGAVINYYLDIKANNVSLEILDSKGTIIRMYTNNDTLYKIPDLNIPLYWIRPQKILSAEAGSHRFLWDMRYTPLNVPPSYPMSAIYKNTVPNPTSPWVMSGSYTVRLIVDGKQFTQTLNIKMDPRVKTSEKDLQLQHDLSLTCYINNKKCRSALKEISEMKDNRSSEIGKEFSKYLRAFTSLHNLLQQSDMPPTSQMIFAFNNLEKEFEKTLSKWNSK